MASTASNLTSGPLTVSDPTRQNVLNSYRSYTYNFTLSGLPAESLNDPSSWKSSSENYVILRSGGKGTTGITAPTGPTASQVEANNLTQQYTEDPNVVKQSQKNIDTLNINPDIVKGFNTNSPGRFDMFIDRLETETQFTFSKTAGLTFPRSFNFTVVEPYSINGFIEALHATAIATGYPNYGSATFLLTIKFLGYPDADNLPSAEEIPNATRSFPITFRTASMEITEKGTVYKCTAFPSTDLAFANPNTLKKSISFQGSTVVEALAGPLPRPSTYDGSCLVDRLNSMQKDASDNRTKSTIYDEYQILFPEINPDGSLDFSRVNKIGQSDLAPHVISGESGNFVDPQLVTGDNNYLIPTGNTGTGVTTELRLDPSTKKYQLQFSEGTRIHEIITNTIRDSEYINNILKNLKDPGTIDEYGMIDYFVIRSQTEASKELNLETQNPKQIYKFIVTPYKVHASSLSLTQPTQFDPKNYKQSTVRQYNYLYTGENIDVINFRLNFDYLFYQAIPYEINNDEIPSKDGAGPTNATDATKKVAVTAGDLAKDQTPANKNLPMPAKIVPDDGSGAPRSDDPYRNLSRFIHSALLNASDASVARGELEILGDPLYICTGGQGNYNPTVLSRGITTDGEADLMSGQVLIRLNFRNPIDYGTLKQGGLMQFDSNLVPFSGIYLVYKVQNVFADGVFKQRLSLVRQPGQVEQATTTAKPFSSSLDESSNSNDITVPDTTDAAPVTAGQVSDATIKRLGGQVLTGLAGAAALASAVSILKGVSGKSSAAISTAIAAASGAVAIKALSNVQNLGSSSVANLVNGTGSKVATSANVAPAVAETNSITDAAKNNVPVDTLDKTTLVNIPKFAAPSVAPAPQVDVATLDALYKSGGTSAIAKAYGVKDISQVSSELLPADTLKVVESSVPITTANPLFSLNNVTKNIADATAGADKLSSVKTLLNIIPKG